MTTTADFWDRIAPKYARTPIKNMDAYEETLDRTRAWLKAEDRVLELGCGTGTTALRLAPAVAQITATDISPAMIGIAQDKAQKEGVENAAFRAGSVAEALTETEEVDAILAFNLLHLVQDLPGTLSAIRNQLQPGQHFISKTPSLGGRPLVRLVVTVMRAIGKAPFVNFVRAEELEEMIRQAGFEIVETGDYPAKPANHFIVARAI
jgi:ubiquinone/menaquinone biosynthesis C-methylase UbiE